MEKQPIKYKLGIDLGTSSIGLVSGTFKLLKQLGKENLLLSEKI